jgi:hypothetical protein
MKISVAFYQTRINPNPLNNEYDTLGDNLEIELTKACKRFIEDIHSNLLERARQLSIDQRIALSHYMTGLKIQNFAINASRNDNETLESEVNDFLKQYDKLTKL